MKEIKLSREELLKYINKIVEEYNLYTVEMNKEGYVYTIFFGNIIVLKLHISPEGVKFSSCLENDSMYIDNESGNSDVRDMMNDSMDIFTEQFEAYFSCTSFEFMENII